MKQLLLFFLLSISAVAQKSFLVKDSSTNEPIAYTSIFTENGTFKVNAEPDGSFIIPNEFLHEVFVFDAVGYETKQQLLTDVVLLEPKSELLDEVVIVPRLGTKEVKVGKIDKKKSINIAFNEKGKGYLHASKFNIENSEYKFIKEISIRTNSKTKDAKFALKIYSSNEKGEPNELLHDVPIIGSAKKGKNITTVNVEDLKLQVFSKSIFVVVDQLYLEENSYYEEYDGKKEKFYDPRFSLNTSNESNIWYYNPTLKKWIHVNFDSDPDYHKEKYFVFQIELTLTN